MCCIIFLNVASLINLYSYNVCFNAMQNLYFIPEISLCVGPIDFEFSHNLCLITMYTLLLYLFSTKNSIWLCDVSFYYSVPTKCSFGCSDLPSRM